MKQLQLRYAQPEESETILKWLHENKINHFDPGILKYPTLKVICAYDQDGAVCYLPVHAVEMMESIALKPEINPLLAAQALRDVTKATEFLAHSQGMREVYFMGGDGKVGDMAEGTFEKVSLASYRRKL